MAVQQNSRLRLRDRLRARPRLWGSVALVLVLLIGLGLGAAAGAGPAEQERDRARLALTAEQERARALEDRVQELEAELEGANEELASEQERIRSLTAKGEVPNFAGDTLEEAREWSSEFRWKFITRRAVASAAPGTVIDQSPGPGVILKAGRTISLTLAQKAPPSWKTIKVLEGSGGTDKTDEFRVPDGTVRLVYNLYAPDSNAALTLYRRPAEYVDLLVNEIGSQDGETRLYEAGVYYLEVIANSYRIEIQRYG